MSHTHTAILNLYKPATDDALGDSLTGFNANVDILDNAVIGVAGVLTLAHGGTAKALTAANGGIVYSDSDSLEILAATATAGQILRSGSNAAPSWSTPTYPNVATLGKILIGDGTNVIESTPKYPNASATAGKIIRSDGTDYASSTSTFADTYSVSTILYASSANVVAGLATGNSGVLVTSAGGVPSIATDIPTAVTIGSAYIYRASGTDIPVADGGTGLSAIADGSILVANTADTLSALTWHSAGTKMLVNTSGVLSMESVTGSGAPVLANTPTLITPVLGVATATSITAISNAGLGLYEDSGAGIFVEDGGYVGIGTANPNKVLHILENFQGVGGIRIQNTASGSSTQVQNVLENNANSLAYYGITSSDYSIYPILNGGKAFFGSYAVDTVIFTQSAHDIVFATNGTESARIKSGGNIGIGTPTPNTLVHVKAGAVIQQKWESTAAYFILDFLTTGGESYIVPAADTLSIWTGAIGAAAERVRIDGTGNVGIATTGASAKLAINGGLHVGGDSDPGDNNLLVDGTTTTDKLVVTTATGYAEMYMYNNVTACEIDVANVYHAVLHSFGNNDGTLAPLIDTTHFTYKAGIHYAIASVADYNAPTSTQIKITITAGHALLAGEPITLTGTTDYDGTYLVLAAGLSGTEFVVTKTYTQTRTGSARRAATLKCLIAGIYRASFNASGVPVNPNDNFKWELNKDDIALDNICARAIWSSATKYEAVSGSGLVSLTVGQHVWMSVKNYSGTSDLTISNANVCLTKVK